MHRSPAIDDYAKAIFALQTRGGEPVTTSALAERLGITPGSVSAMLKRLDELGLVTHEPYRGVLLTAAGRRVALEVIRHHRLLSASWPTRWGCRGIACTTRPSVPRARALGRSSRS